MPFSQISSSVFPRNCNSLKGQWLYMGVGFGVLFWLFSAALHKFIFNHGENFSLIREVFNNNPHELFIRGFVFILFLSFGAYTQLMVARQKETNQFLRKAQEKIKESEERYRAIVEIIPDGITISDRGKILFANDGFAKIVGLTKSTDIEGKHLRDFGPPEPPSKEGHERTQKDLRNNKLGVDEEVPVIGKDGKISFLYSTSAPISYKGKSAVLKIHRDVTEKKLEEEERNRLITELQKTLSEVKTLRGFLPICSHCKKIRDDKGYWNQIESYIHKHSDTEFSHSICPECAKKYFPDMDIYDDKDA